MRRRSTASDQPAKSRRRKTQIPKRRSARKAKLADSPSASSAEAKIAQLTRERDDALEQQRAAAEVLRIISASPTEFRLVLEVIVESAARFCDADDVTIFELDGQDLCLAAHRGPIPHEIGVRFPCTRGSVAGRTVIDRKAVHVIDLQTEADEFPEGSAFARRFGHRTTACVPLLREGAAIGTIQIRRTEVNPFTDKQMALLGTFADQAVIAIENARLLDEIRHRNDELAEALEFQTATGEVLRIVASSPENLQSVFDAMLDKAIALCEAKFGILHLHDGKGFTVAADRHLPPAYAQAMRGRSLRAEENIGISRLISSKAPLHVRDMFSDGAYARREPLRVAAVDLGGVRSLVAVPLLKKGEVVGWFAIYRAEPADSPRTRSRSSPPLPIRR